MSFADELKKSYEITKDYSWERERAQQCIEAIKNACVRNCQQGLDYISGGFYCDDTDYGTYEILEKGRETLFIAEDRDYMFIRDEIIDEIKELGFENYKVSLVERDIMKSYTNWMGSKKTRPMGKKGYSFFVEIKW